MGTRKECRERLAALFTANGSFTAVFDYAPTTFNGASKVLTIYSDSTRHDMLTAHLNNNFYIFFLDVFVKRAGATTEDDLDTLHEAVRSVVRTNVADSNWNELFLDEDSECSFVEVAGVPYRMESHRLRIKVAQT